MTAPEVLDGWNSNWWALGLRALAAILLGVIAIAMPGPTLGAIVIVFGLYAVIDGVLAIIAAIRGVRRKERWGAMLAEGIVGIVAGAIALAWPAIGALALTYLVAAWALATGALEIAAAVRLRKIMSGEWLLLIAGLLSIVFAVLVAVFPGPGALTLVWWLGAYALLYGFVSLGLAFRVRSWTHARA
jgi:uncharacterized membrane protein HdeD (DUF308 family)